MCNDMFRELLSRKCPCCNKSLGISQRLPLLNREPLTCIYCAKPLKPKLNVMLFNIFWLCMSVSWIVKTHTELNYFWACSVSLLFASTILPALDLLFPLEEEQYCAK